MKIGFKLLILLATIWFAGCGSSMYKYEVKPTPIKQGEAKYVLKDFNLKLEHGHGRNSENKTFKTEEELKNSFEEFINKELKARKLLGDKNSFQMGVDMTYKRKYNHGGKSLGKPEFFYTVRIYDSRDKLLASFSIPKSTTKYGSFKDIAVNVKVATFKWGAEDEPQDIELISKTLVEELSELGD